MRIGLGADIEACVRVDAYGVAPVLDRGSGLLVKG
jgi:hypothetical protein